MDRPPVRLPPGDHADGRHDEDVARRDELQILVVDRHVVRHVDEAPGAGRDQPLVVLQRGRMRDHPDVPHLRLVEDGRIDVRVQLHPRAPPLVPLVHPDLQDPDAARRLGPHRLARLGRAAHPVQPPPPGVVRESGVRSAAGDPHPGRHQVAGAGDVAHPLRLPDLEGDLLAVAAGGDDCPDAVVGVAVQVVDEVLAGEVLRAPARVALPAEMRVRVDERRHHGMAGQVDDGRLRRRLHLAGVPDPHDAIAADQERGVFDDASVSDDHASAGEQPDCLGGGCGIRRLALRASRDARQKREHHQGDDATPDAAHITTPGLLVHTAHLPAFTLDAGTAKRPRPGTTWSMGDRNRDRAASLSRRYERDSTRNVHQLSGRGVSSGGGSPPPPGWRACTAGFCSLRIRVAQTWSSWAGSISRLRTTG